MTKEWYTTSKADRDNQGLVCDANTGRNIAVTYNVEDAPLVAAAPELLEALKICLAELEDWNRGHEWSEGQTQAQFVIHKFDI